VARGGAVRFGAVETHPVLQPVGLPRSYAVPMLSIFRLMQFLHFDLAHLHLRRVMSR
jgi:hypothetical protein